LGFLSAPLSWSASLSAVILSTAFFPITTIPVLYRSYVPHLQPDQVTNRLDSVPLCFQAWFGPRCSSSVETSENAASKSRIESAGHVVPLDLVDIDSAVSSNAIAIVLMVILNQPLDLFGMEPNPSSSSFTELSTVTEH